MSFEVLAPLKDLEEGELLEQSAEARLEAEVAHKSTSQTESEGLHRLVGATWDSQSRKTKRKQLQKALNAGQSIDLAVYRDVYGTEAAPSVVLTQPERLIRVPDIQALVLWVLADRKDGKNPGWAFVKNVPLVKQVVLLFVPCISSHIFKQRQDLFPNLANLGRPVTVLSKDGLVKPAYQLTMLMMVPFPKAKKQYLNQTAAGLDSSNGAAQPRPFRPDHYILKPDMMEKLGYPLPLKADDGSSQPPQGEEAGEEVLVALDCEMCETFAGVYELTRISLLSESGEVLYDQLVRPYNSIMDYHTDKSGITEALLKDVTTRLEDVQEQFLKLVPASTILVGHALENDLKALKVVHMRCIDTGALFPHPKGLPFRSALRRLAEKFLKRKIQQGSHDPLIDAQTALDLALLKMKHGPAFGLATQQAVGEPLLEVLMRANRRCSLVDQPDTLRNHLTGNADGISCKDDAEVVTRLCKEVRKESPPNAAPRFVWGQLRSLSQFYEERAYEKGKALAALRAKAALEESSTLQETGTAAQQNGQPKPAPNGCAAESITNAETLSGSKRSSDSPAIEGPPAKRFHQREAADVSMARQNGEGAGDEDQILNIMGVQEHAQDDAVAEPAEAITEKEEGEQEDDPEEKLLRRADTYVGRIHDTLPADTLLIVATCQGDTAATRFMHERKVRRCAGVEKPAWSQADEHRFCKEFVEVSQQGLCFATVKES